MPPRNVKKQTSKKRSVFKRIELTIGWMIGLVVGVIILIVAILSVQHMMRSSSQNIKFTSAQSRCNKDPYVIVKETGDLLGGSISYYVYAPSNPDYQKMKTVVAGSVDVAGKTEVYDYYCSIDEAKAAALPLHGGGYGAELTDSATNYNSDENQQTKDTYLTSQKAIGMKFYAPKELLKGFRVKAKQLTPKIHHYNIGYVGDTAATKGIGEQEPINLICQPLEEARYGDKVATNRYGGDIYLEEDQYNLNIRSHLPTALCTLQTKTGQLNHADGIALVLSIEEVAPSVIAGYDLDLF